ncbi:MAG: hypothetical protein QXE05_04845 [Nitrososphaeria archaeon]
MNKLSIFLYILFIMISEAFVFSLLVPSNIYSLSSLFDTFNNGFPSLPSNTSIFAIVDWLSFIIKLLMFILSLPFKFIYTLFNIIAIFITVIMNIPLLLPINLILLLVLFLIIASWLHIGGSGIDL